MQQTIYNALRGIDRRAFKGCGALDTAELLEELLEHGHLGSARPRKQLMGTVVRACSSLQRRGLLTGVYRHDVNNPGRYTVEWSATDTEPREGARKGGE